MRFWRFIFLAPLLSALAPAGGNLQAGELASPTEDVVWLASGERYHGGLVTEGAGKALFWQHPFILEKIPLKLEEIAKIRLGPRPVTVAKPVNPCLVRLANGDELEGELAGYDGESVRLDTWFAGTLRLPRQRIESLQPLVPNPKIVFQGPTSLEGWTLGNAVVPGVVTNAWSYSDGALVSLASGSIARDVKLPEVASIEFDLSWNAYVHIAIALFADSLQPINLTGKDEAPDFGGFYSLQLSANIANVLAVKKGAPLNSLGMAFIPGMEMKSAAHITIRAHRANRLLYLYVDGALVKQWQDPFDTAGPGTCLRIVNQGPNALRLSNLVVAEWDGRLDVQTNVVNNLTNDVVRLLNRDAVAGVIKEVRDGQVQLVSAMGAITIPLNRVEQLHFSRANRDLLPISTNAVTAHFTKRGKLTLDLDGWEGGQLVAASPVFGRARLSLGAFRLLEWPKR